MKNVNRTKGIACQSVLFRQVFVVIFMTIMLATVEQSYSQVAIAVSGTPVPDASAMLDITSNSKGVLLPRMTASERTSITTPATGLMVYQTEAPIGFYYYNGTAWTRVGNSPVTYTASPADPITGTTNNTTGVMMGLGTTNSFTPQVTGKVRILITGMIGMGAVGGTASIQIRYGTGTAPNNASALSGTTLGALKKHVASTIGGKQGFALCGIATALTIGTGYWIDVSLTSSSSVSTATIYNIDVVADEIQ